MSNKQPQWFTGSEYTHKVARTIAQHGPIARTTLAQMLNISQGALSRITSDLIYDKVIQENSNVNTKVQDDRSDSEHRGRPQTALEICAQERTFIGINIHENGIALTITDALCKSLIDPVYESISSQDPSQLIEHICTLIIQHSRLVNPAPCFIGISLGGHAVDNTTVTFAPFLHWNKPVELSKIIEEKTHIPCLVFNDLDSLLLHEGWFGSGVGLSRFAILTIGAGIGYSLTEHGEAIDYPDKSYGLVGHIPIDPKGPRCYAGHHGCSQCLTNDSIAEEYSQLINKQCTFTDFVQDLENNSSAAKQLANILCFRLGTLIAITANFAMPEKILISGESSFIARYNLESVRNGITHYRQSQTKPVDFEILDFTWNDWACSAAAMAIASYIG
ncbi:MAG: ROK family protein [Bifidobacteriaceae bacterium]|nr:ROK family protein [Bifidobacteriaceae bacterium]